MKKYGSYAPDEIREGFRYWRNYTEAELMREIDASLLYGTKMPLVPVKTNPQTNNTYDRSNSWKQEIEQRIITDGFLDKILENNQSASLLDLVFKNIAKNDNQSA